MSLVAIVDPATLLGQSMRDLLAVDGGGYEIRLLDSSAGAEGTLTQIGSEVALVHALEAEALSDAELVILCGDSGRQHATLEMVDDSVPVILFDRGGSPDGRRVVAGVNDAEISAETVLISPHPGVVALSHLLAPLLALAPRAVSATLLTPTSSHDEAGLDELFEQTRRILTFQGDMSTTVFPAQLAFNLLPGAGADLIGPQTAKVLGNDLPISVQLVQAPVFHSLSLSVHLELTGSTSSDAVREALGRSSYLEIVEDASTLGPIDATAREEILVGAIGATNAAATTFGLWAVMDNLTRGGANNAAEIARRALAAD